MNNPQEAIYLFVYGTFLQGMPHGKFLNSGGRADFISKATLAATMFDAGGYPAIILDGQNGATTSSEIVGEIYCIEEPWTVLSTIDIIKGCNPALPESSLFQRVACKARNGDEAWKVQVYTYNQSIEGLPRIASGSYLAYLQEKNTGGTRA